MTLPKVGQTTEDLSLHGRRDAFHFPAILVNSYAHILPGEYVRFYDEGYKEVKPCGRNEADAVVDPFLPQEETITAGTLFWVFLHPSKVEGLVHHFVIKQSDKFFELKEGENIVRVIPPKGGYYNVLPAEDEEYYKRYPEDDEEDWCNDCEN